MAKNNFVLVDLNDSKTKKLAEVITSKTSRKILNHLTEKEDTETNIAKELGIAISTVHYHLQKLREAKLIVVDEFHYSKKGREVNHYKLANKYIIIAPKKVSGLKQALKNVLPVGLIVLGISGVIKLVMSQSRFMGIGKQATFAAEKAMSESATMMEMEVADKAAQVSSLGQVDIALWFLIGGFAALLVYLLVIIIKEFLKKR